MLSLLRLERKQKNSSNPFRIRIFLFLSYSFGIETTNTFIHSVVPSKTIPVFRPKRPKNPSRWGGTYLYGLYKGVLPPPPGNSPLNIVHKGSFFQPKAIETHIGKLTLLPNTFMVILSLTLRQSMWVEMTNVEIQDASLVTKERERRLH